MALQISEHLSLRPISLADHKQLWTLMSRIYPQAYRHYWKDEGLWYLDKIYSLPGFQQDMLEPSAHFFFIQWKGKPAGVFRFIEDKSLIDKPDCRATKLQRIYLGEEAQSKGIGRKLFRWLENRQRKLGYELLWLEAMDQQPQALGFYRAQGYQLSSTYLLDFEPMYDEMRSISRFWKKL